MPWVQWFLFPRENQNRSLLPWRLALAPWLVVFIICRWEYCNYDTSFTLISYTQTSHWDKEGGGVSKIFLHWRKQLIINISYKIRHLVFYMFYMRTDTWLINDWLIAFLMSFLVLSHLVLFSLVLEQIMWLVCYWVLA